MKKILSFILILTLIIGLSGCGDTSSNNGTSSNNDSSYTIDYKDAKTFETALNNGEKVNGKVVRFEVAAYKPDSGLGINCWAGEHLNFISKKELDVEEGDVIVGRVTKEASTVLGSWKIPYEVLEIEKKQAGNKTDSHEHSFASADCLNPAKCACGETEGYALGHAYEQGKCTRCGATDPNFSSVSVSKQNALKSAKSYLKISAFSREGLIGQLEYEEFSNEDAVYAVDNCGADWNEQALKSAKSYLKYSSFSYKGLKNQLEYEEFTSEQAKYAVDNCGADWNEQAKKTAESYLKYSSFSRQKLIDQLEYEGFTSEQAI